MTHDRQPDPTDKESAMKEPRRLDADTAQRIKELVIAQQVEDSDGSPDPEAVSRQMRQIIAEFTRLRMQYQFGIDEVLTKITILRKEFEHLHDSSPIEHVRTRLKSPESLLEKAVRTGGDLSVSAIRGRIFDIAGIRVTCAFISDVYWIAEMLSQQPDLEVLQVKDYIASPKPNGYRSLHLIVQVPVFLSTHTEPVPVELQIRTIAMDFWASTEHKLSYKYEKQLPDHLAAELDEAARIATELDGRMGRLRDEIRPDPEHDAGGLGDAVRAPSPGA